MKKIILLLFVLCMPLAFAQPENYKYFRDIDTTNIREPVWVSIDSKLLEMSESDGQDIRIYSGSQEISYHLDYSTGIAPLKILDIAATSEQQSYGSGGFKPSNMLDGSTKTYYQNNFVEDVNQTRIEFSIGDAYKLEKITFIFTQAPRSTTIYTNINGKSFKVATSSSSSISLNSIKTDKLTAVFDHDGTIKINQATIYGQTSGKILFSPVSDKSMIYYGNANDKMPDYDVEHLFTNAGTNIIQASNQRINLLFKGETEGGLNDNCPLIPNPDQTDSDNDGIGDACDNCRFGSNKNQADRDNDGIGDVCDNCPAKSNPDQLDQDLDGLGWVCDDDDHDGIVNSEDNCLKGYNPNQQDVDRNGIGDECEDDDGDIVPNYLDLCRNTPDFTNVDSDKDGIGDACDNCKTISNRNQRDDDKNGIGNACEDTDSDGAPDGLDNCPLLPNPDQVDWDSDKIGDACDNCPEHKNTNQQDIDRDGIGDACDSEESRILENPKVIWTIMILAAGIIVGLAFFVRKK